MSILNIQRKAETNSQRFILNILPNKAYGITAPGSRDKLFNLITALPTSENT